MTDLIRKVVHGNKGVSSGGGMSEKQHAQRGANGFSAKKTMRFAGRLSTGFCGAYGAGCASHIELERREDRGGRQMACSPENAAGLQRTIVTEVFHTKAAEKHRHNQGRSQQELAPHIHTE